MQRNAYLMEMRPLSYIMRALGWLAFTRHSDPSGNVELQLKWVSWAALYSALAVSLQLGLGLWVLNTGLKLVTQKSSDEQIMSYFFLFGNFVPLVLPPFVLLQMRHQLAFCTKWGEMQANLERSAPSGQLMQLGLRRYATLIASLAVGGVLVGIVGRTLVLHRAPSVVEYLKFIGYINEILVFSWWIISCRSLEMASKQLLREYNEDGKTRQLLEDALLDFRLLWLQLASLVGDSGDALSLAQATLVIFNFSRLLFSAYMICTILEWGIFAVLGIPFVISVFAVTSMCRAAHNLQHGLRRDLLEAIAVTKHMKISESVRIQVLEFLLHMLRNETEVTFSGYLQIGRRLISTLVSAFITNIVVILQLQIHHTHMTFDQFIDFNQQFYQMKPSPITQDKL